MAIISDIFRNLCRRGRQCNMHGHEAELLNYVVKKENALQNGYVSNYSAFSAPGYRGDFGTRLHRFFTNTG